MRTYFQTRGEIDPNKFVQILTPFSQDRVVHQGPNDETPRIYEKVGTFSISAETLWERLALRCKAIFFTIITLGLSFRSAETQANFQGRSLVQGYVRTECVAVNESLLKRMDQLERDKIKLSDSVKEAEKENGELSGNVEELVAENQTLTDRVERLKQNNTFLFDRSQALEEENTILKASATFKINGQENAFWSKTLRALIRSNYPVPELVPLNVQNSSFSKMKLQIRYNKNLRKFGLALLAIGTEGSPGKTFRYMITTSSETRIMEQSMGYNCSPEWEVLGGSVPLEELTPEHPYINQEDKEESSYRMAAWLSMTETVYRIDFPSEYQLGSFTIQIDHPSTEWATEILQKQTS